MSVTLKFYIIIILLISTVHMYERIIALVKMKHFHIWVDYFKTFDFVMYRQTVGKRNPTGKAIGKMLI